MHESKGSEMETTRPLRGAGRSKGKGVRRMELTIKGEAKEIAALVLELQERHRGAEDQLAEHLTTVLEKKLLSGTPEA